MKITIKNKDQEEKQLFSADFLPCGVMIFECGTKLKLRYYNNLVPQIFGFSREDFHKKLENGDILNLRYPADLDESRLSTLAKKGAIVEKNIITERANASAMWLNTASSILLRDNRYYCHTVLRDITDMHNAETDLQAAAAVQELTGTETGAVSFEYTPGSDTFLCRGKRADLYSSVSDSIDGRYLNKFCDWVRTTVPSGEQLPFDFMMILSDGREHLIRGKSVTLRDKYGCPYRNIGIFRDCGINAVSDSGISARISGYGKSAAKLRELSMIVEHLMEDTGAFTMYCTDNSITCTFFNNGRINVEKLRNFPSGTGEYLDKILSDAIIKAMEGKSTSFDGVLKYPIPGEYSLQVRPIGDSAVSVTAKPKINE